MNTVMNWWGRRLPSSPAEACQNLKENLCNPGKMLRVFTSAALGVTGLGLVLSCKSCGDLSSSCNMNGTITASPTSNSTEVSSFSFMNVESQNILDLTGQFCLVAGVLQGVASSVVVCTSLVRKVVIPWKNVLKDSDHVNLQQHANKATAETVLEAMPTILAGSLGTAYGLVSLPLAVLSKQSSSWWNLENILLGGGSSAFYLLDVLLGSFDLCCSDLSHIRRMAEAREQQLEEDGRLCIPLVKEGESNSMMLVVIPKKADDVWDLRIGNSHEMYNLCTVYAGEPLRNCSMEEVISKGSNLAAALLSSQEEEDCFPGISVGSASYSQASAVDSGWRFVDPAEADEIFLRRGRYVSLTQSQASGGDEDLISMDLEEEEMLGSRGDASISEQDIHLGVNWGLRASEDDLKMFGGRGS